jgi:hypothetical protein
VLAVQPDGSLKLVSGVPGQIESLFRDSGYTLAPGATHQFTYSGIITSFGGKGITSGAGYYIVLIGSETLSVQTVVAG